VNLDPPETVAAGGDKYPFAVVQMQHRRRGHNRMDLFRLTLEGRGDRELITYSRGC
jgi:hypothetical protein